MQYYHNIELKNSKITNLVIDPLPDDPMFDVDEAGRLYFNTSTQTLRLNTGTEYVSISLPANFDNLTSVLGANWITTDYRFIPDPFNEFQNVDDLDGNSSLFDVLKQFDVAISGVTNSSLMDLSDVIVTDMLNAGNVIYYNGENFTFSSIDDVISNYGNLTLSSLTDIDVTDAQPNDSLFYDAINQVYKSGSIILTINDYQNVTNHSIEHNLNRKYVPVTVINRNDDSIITNAIVTYVDNNQIDIALPNPTPITVVITAPPNFSVG